MILPAHIFRLFLPSRNISEKCFSSMFFFDWAPPKFNTYCWPMLNMSAPSLYPPCFPSSRPPLLPPSLRVLLPSFSSPDLPHSRFCICSLLSVVPPLAPSTSSCLGVSPLSFPSSPSLPLSPRFHLSPFLLSPAFWSFSTVSLARLWLESCLPLRSIFPPLTRQPKMAGEIPGTNRRASHTQPPDTPQRRGKAVDRLHKDAIAAPAFRRVRPFLPLLFRREATRVTW